MVYQDISCRQEHGLADEDAVIRYLCLPTAIARQFVAQMLAGTTTQVGLDYFLEVMATVYSGTQREQIMLVFCMFDFDCDEVITREDVRLMLSSTPT